MNFRIFIAAVTALSFVGIGAADAGSHKRHKRVHHHAAMYVPVSPYALPGPRPIWGAPQQCFTDEGYGRYWPCGAGPNTR